MGTPKTEATGYWPVNSAVLGSVDNLATLLGGPEHFERAASLLCEHRGIRNFVKNLRIGGAWVSANERAVILAAAEFGFAWGTAPTEVSKLDRPSAIANTYRRLATDDSESLVVVGLSPGKVSVGEHVITGGACGVPATVSQVLRAVLLLGADHFLLVHNHPSGDPDPSEHDVKFTRAVCSGASRTGLDLVDHVIVARNGFTSLRAAGVIAF